MQSVNRITHEWDYRLERHSHQLSGYNVTEHT